MRLTMYKWLFCWLWICGVPHKAIISKTVTPQGNNQQNNHLYIVRRIKLGDMYWYVCVCVCVFININGVGCASICGVRIRNMMCTTGILSYLVARFGSGRFHPCFTYILQDNLICIGAIWNSPTEYMGILIIRINGNFHDYHNKTVYNKSVCIFHEIYSEWLACWSLLHRVRGRFNLIQNPFFETEKSKQHTSSLRIVAGSPGHGKTQ